MAKPEARLKFEGGEFFLGSGVVTLGRAADNSISFPDDENVSRYHAEIENRGDYYCLIDLGSSNGLTVNDQPVQGEVYLWDGAEIALGGSARLKVQFAEDGVFKEEEPDPAAAAETENTEPVESAEETAVDSAGTTGGSRKMMYLAGGVFGVAVLVAAGAGAIYLMQPSACDATASIVSPEQGEVLMEPTDVEIDVRNGRCVSRVIYAIHGIEFASSEIPPYGVSVDPNEFPEFADGFDHELTVILEDDEGNRIPSSEPVLLAFETRAIAKPTPGATVARNDTDSGPAQPRAQAVSLIDIHEMSKRLIQQFPANANYNVSNRQFLQEVQRRTAEYTEEGYFNRAAQYRDAINVAYVREQNLDAPLGFMLAMSRSKFVPASQGNEIGLWRMSDAFVKENAYDGLCGTETLADPAQNCAAKASAIYMKALVFGVFDGDIIYSVAAFGRSTQDAGAWKESLPENRTDIWNSVKTAPEREQIVRFFAAGIVAENPARFGLKNDKPLSELYRLTM
jgi:pSer/pThr/pTyr-binding forkhead associated (FHA) protein